MNIAVVNDYLLSKGENVVHCFEYPRTPEVGNCDFSIYVKDGILDIEGSDGYGAVNNAKFVLKKEGVITPIEKGRFILEEGNLQTVTEFIVWLLGLDDLRDFIGSYVTVKSAIETWEDFSWDEKFYLMTKVIK